MTIKPSRPIERNNAISAYEDFLFALGYDVEEISAMCSGPSGKNTAMRAADAMIEFLSKEQEPFDFTVFPSEGVEGMVALANVEFFSLCAHHALPYFGRAHVGYLPNGKVCGLSKIVRIVDHYSHRFSIQEALTSKIATFMEEQLEPQGCGVVIEATHLCMSMRGVSRPGHMTVTSDMRGCFKDTATSAEFIALIARAKDK